ncbi:hypothetical protein [Chitinimonas sp.]|uniref:hypothetical protein n=1 Tax=Chitinimonas sp. TaxID=1934313 RepID=UPI002F93E87E
MKTHHPARRLAGVILPAVLMALPVYAEEVAPPVAPAMSSRHLSVRVDVQPASSGIGRYIATTEVSDLNSNKVLARPKLAFSQHAPASIEVALDEDDLIQVEIRIGADRRSADYQFRHLRGGKLCGRQQLKLRLRA